MHIKRMHEIVEKLTESALCEINKGIEYVNTEEYGEVTDMIKDIAEAEYYARLAKCLEKDEEEKKEWEKAKEIMRMKEDEDFSREEENQRMFYRGQPRSRTSGRYMRRGDDRRSNRGRRGYSDPMMMEEYDPYYLDYLRGEPDRMYYEDNIRSTGTSTATGSGEPYVNPNEMNRYYNGGGTSTSGGGSTSGGTSTMSGSRGSGNSGGMSSGSSYYSDGRRDGRGRNEGRSGRSRSYYMDTKEQNSGNSVHDNNAKMQSLEHYTKELSEDITEMIQNSSEQEKNLLRQKLKMMADKI